MKSMFAITGAAALAIASSASADFINISSLGFGVEGNGAFTGSLAYTSGVLTVTLTNDLSSAAGGRITAFAFNMNGDVSATLTSATYAFQNLTGPISATPLGTFEAGASTSNSWLGGGSPIPGIARGDTGVFTFAITGADAATRTAVDFISGGSGVNFAVRFRGFENGGSDKTGGNVVPTPGSLALMGLGLFGLRRRR